MNVEDVIKKQVELYKLVRSRTRRITSTIRTNEELIAIYNQVNNTLRGTVVPEEEADGPIEIPTPKQIAFMDKHKILYSEETTKDDAAKLIDKEITSWKKR